MDNITHTLTGLALSRAGLGRATRGATMALVLASNLPDIDLIASVQGSAAYLEHHRGFTHSIVGAPLLAIALALLLRVRLKGSRVLPLLLCSLVGVSGHLFMDVWTSYGTRVLSPFDRRWLTWDLVFIIDPYVLSLLAIAVLWKRASPSGPRIASLGLGLVLSYAGARAVLHAQAIDEAAARLAGRSIQRIAALPSAINPFAWRVLADTGDAYWSGDLDLRGRTPPLARREKHVEDATVAHVRAESEIALLFLDFSPFPWLEVEKTAEGTEVVWRDLRFERRGRPTFVARVVVGPDGRIRSQAFQF